MPTFRGEGGTRHTRLVRRAAVIVLPTLAAAACAVPSTPAPTTITAPPTKAAPSPTATVTPDRVVTILGAGDLLVHNPVARTAAAYARQKGTGEFDFHGMFADVKAHLSAADIAICHQETPLTPTNTRLTLPGSLVFNTPHELATAAKDAGFDGCDYASNHSLDQGVPGIASSRSVLEKAGLTYAGASPTRSERGITGWYEAKGFKVAHLAYSYTLFNNFDPNTDVPADGAWLKSSLWLAQGAEGIRRDAQAARAEGADLVVVSLHWGAQYVTSPTAQQRQLAKDLLGSPDVDLILGTHVHVVQPCERINGKYVFYGMGNFLSNQSPQVDPTLRPETQEGVIVEVTFTKAADGTVTSAAAYTPTRVDLQGHVIRIATPKSNPTTFNRVTKTLQADGAASCPIQPSASPRPAALP